MSGLSFKSDERRAQVNHSVAPTAAAAAAIAGGIVPVVSGGASSKNVAPFALAYRKSEISVELEYNGNPVDFQNQLFSEFIGSHISACIVLPTGGGPFPVWFSYSIMSLTP